MGHPPSRLEWATRAISTHNKAWRSRPPQPSTLLPRSADSCATSGLHDPGFRFSDVEDHNTSILWTSMLRQSDVFFELLVSEFDVPGTREDTACDTGQVDPVSGYFKMQIERIFAHELLW